MQKSVAIFFESGGGKLTFVIVAECRVCVEGVVEFPGLKVGWLSGDGYFIQDSDQVKWEVENHWKKDPEKVRGACKQCGTMAQLTPELACSVLESQDWLAQVPAPSCI